MAATGFTEEEIRGREEKEIDRMLGFSSQEANTEYLTKIQGHLYLFGDKLR